MFTALLINLALTAPVLLPDIAVPTETAITPSSALPGNLFSTCDSGTCGAQAELESEQLGGPADEAGESSVIPGPPARALTSWCEWRYEWRCDAWGCRWIYVWFCR